MPDTKHPYSQDGRPEDDPNLNDPIDAGYEQEGADEEVDQPRRAASARFIVETEVGSEAALRDAMDPANQSLADAMRLSYRVLQSVIIVLIVLFLISGFQTVEEGQSGVKTVWGEIVTVDGSEALTPGPKFSIYPYPIAEFILFKDENRVVDLVRQFTPSMRGVATYEQMLERADVSMQLIPGPGGDGSLLTRDGDLAHMELSARYAIDQAGAFVRRVNDADPRRSADRLVELALRRAAIQVAAESSLQELIDQPDDIRMRIQIAAQEALDELECGLELTHVQVQRAYAPLAIVKALGDLQAARVDAAERIERARQRANETLNKVAGSEVASLLAMIDEYEEAEDRGEDAHAADLYRAITAKLETIPDGEVANIIQTAKAYKSQIESTLGNEHRRFASLLPAYRQNPQLLMRKQWLETYSQVLSRPDAETIYVDPMMSVRLALTGSASIQELRRRNQVQRREMQQNLRDYGDPMQRYLRARDYVIDRPGRILDIDPERGRAVPYGTRQR